MMIRLIFPRALHTGTGENPVREAYRFIAGLRHSGMTEGDPPKLERLILDSPVINNFNEKYLCLTLSLVVQTNNFYPNPIVVESLSKRILCISDLTLQGANQVLGAFAKLKSENPEFESHSMIFCQKVFDIFQSKFIEDCPNRELSNVFWAASILRLENLGDSFLARNRLTDPVAKTLQTFDCVDLSLVCAALIENPDSSLWPVIRSELLARRKFTRRDIPSIMCSLACAGITDRELMLHLCNVILRRELLDYRNLPAIVWAVATADAVHHRLIDQAVEIINKDGYKIKDSLDLRRISRGFAVNGHLGRIDKWLLKQVIPNSRSSSDVSDTVLIWELVTNQLSQSALRVFRSKPLCLWQECGDKDALIQSQLYHMYLASLVDPTLDLTQKEVQFLKSLRDSFSSATGDMSSSTLHKNASEALRKLEYKHISEYKEPISGYLIDTFVPEENAGIEVQGPTHFITDLETGASILRPADAFKHEVLRKVSGMRIVQATPWNFGPKLKQKNTVLMKALLEGRPISNHSRI